MVKERSGLGSVWNAGLLENEVLMERLCGVVLEAAALWIYIVPLASDLGVAHGLMVFLRILLPQEAIFTMGIIASMRRFGPLSFAALVNFER